MSQVTDYRKCYPFNLLDEKDVNIENVSIKLLNRCIEEFLTDREKEIIQRYAKEGEEAKSIADSMGLGVSTVYKDIKKIIWKINSKRKFFVVDIDALFSNVRLVKTLKSDVDRLEGELAWYKKDEARVKRVEEAKRHAEEDDMPIENLNLDTRAYNCLKRAGYKTIGDIKYTLTIEKLSSIWNMGVKTAEYVLKVLSDHGITLPDS